MGRERKKTRKSLLLSEINMIKLGLGAYESYKIEKSCKFSILNKVII